MTTNAHETGVSRLPATIWAQAKWIALPRSIADEYARDAIALLGAPPGASPALTATGCSRTGHVAPGDRENNAALIALRISEHLHRATERLGMAAVSLFRWIGRRKLPMHLNT